MVADIVIGVLSRAEVAHGLAAHQEADNAAELRQKAVTLRYQAR
jgi:hypothetical protein